MNKLIAAIEALPDTSNVEAYPANYDSDEVLASFKGKDLKALVAQLKWIPVSERLPMESGYYCATRKTESGRTYTWQTHYDHASQLWSVTGNEQIIAWRPLPEPYTAERGEE